MLPTGKVLKVTVETCLTMEFKASTSTPTTEIVSDLLALASVGGGCFLAARLLPKPVTVVVSFSRLPRHPVGSDSLGKSP